MGTCFSSSSSSSRRKMDLAMLTANHYSSALYDYDRLFLTSDEHYARNLQEALLSSMTASMAEIDHHPHIPTCAKQKQEESEIQIEDEPVETSRRLYCMICMDEKPSSHIFRGTTDCTGHSSYCTECIVRYVATKIEENVGMIKCPDVDCTRLIEPYTCRGLIRNHVFERWDKALCESLILSSEKVYCPFEDCSAMMVVDEGNDAKVTQTECPSCHRRTWHAGIGCKEFRRFGNTTTTKKSTDEEDALLIKMAKNKRWRRCPSCKFYVDKVDGCLHIDCRCGFSFCYGCGSAWSYRHICSLRFRSMIFG